MNFKVYSHPKVVTFLAVHRDNINHIKKNASVDIGIIIKHLGKEP